jgi:NADPH:quinone reductase-like Zn-dependent oxidoreductase
VASETAYRWVATRPGGLEVLELVPVDVPAPAAGEVTIDVRAAGINPADYKRIASGGFTEPMPVGFEVSGVVRELGPGTHLASGGGHPGDEVLAFRISGGYASRLTVPAKDVFAKPPGLEHPAAANLLLAGTTAAEMLHVTGVAADETVVLHGASGAVGVSVLQQARLIGARVVGTAGPNNFDVVRRFGATPVAYGDGLESRLRELAPEGFAAALDAVGTDEAVDVSLALVSDRDRIVTIAAARRAREEGTQAIGGAMPASAAFRDDVRARLIKLAGEGKLVVPVARTYPLQQAREALAFLQQGHPGGKLALLT